eukprot:390496-Ditylum_brightwellii.AAC.1
MYKLLTAHGFHHPQADVNCLYLHQAEGGHGLTSLWDTYAYECTALMQYIRESDNPLTSMIPTASTPIVNHLNQFSQGQQYCTLDQTNDYHCAKLQKRSFKASFLFNNGKYCKSTLTCWKNG